MVDFSFVEAKAHQQLGAAYQNLAQSPLAIEQYRGKQRTLIAIFGRVP